MSNIKKFDSQIDFLENAEEAFISSKNDETAIAVLKKCEVIYNDNSGCNVEYCEKNNIRCYEGKINNIGTGVIEVGSVVLTIKRNLKNRKVSEAFSDMFSKALAQYLKGKGLSSVRCDNNDVMVDDGKVASGGEIIINDFIYVGYQISINQNIEAIKNICYKPMVKIPKALSDYGITTEEIVEFCEQYLSNN